MAEKFKLLDFLGAGAFARTHLAEVLDTKLKKEWGEKVVIKIPLSKEKEEVLVNELIMNASLHLNLQQAKARNIVKYLGYSKYTEFYVMVMEHIEGQTLRRILGSVGQQEPLTVEEALNISEQICEGLKEIHRVHIIHRDIKPENILICKKDREVKIMDFGISRFLSTDELASTTTGSIYYMAKEVIEEGGSFYSDVYSVGVTMYEMLTGQLPFVGKSIGEIIHNICTQVPKPLKEVNPSIDGRLNKIVLKAIEKDPVTKRYRTVEDILEAIRIYRQGKDEEDEHIERYVSEAQELFIAGKYSEAEIKLRELEKKCPGHPKTYLSLGEFYNRCQRHKEAIKVFKKGIEVSPDYALLHRDMALSLYQEKQKKEAIKSLQKAMELGLESSLEKHAKTLLKLWETNR